jgi:hypothetical protein
LFSVIVEAPLRLRGVVGKGQVRVMLFWMRASDARQATGPAGGRSSGFTPSVRREV